MIPREILKKIRQIEIRTNRVVSGFAERGCPSRSTSIAVGDSDTSRARCARGRAAGETPALRSLQPPAQFFGVASAVKNRDDADEMRLNGEIDAVTDEDFNSDLVNGLAREGKSFRVLKDAGKCRVNFGFKSVAQTRLLLVIPEDGIFKFQPRLRLEDYLAGHARRESRRSLSSARTRSHGMPVSGLRRSCSARRSNSAICSGDGWSANLARKSWKISRCSSIGSFSTCLMTCVALMAVIYSFDLFAQAGFSASRITHYASRHP